MSQYMTVLILSGCVPLAASLYPGLAFWSKWRALLYSIFLIILIFGGWDVFAVWRGHWSFNPVSVASIRIFNLPLEEVLFFAVIPFCCLFTWEVFLLLERRRR